MMYRRFLDVSTGNAIKIFDAGGLKVTWAVPEKHIINFFGLNICKKNFKTCPFYIYNLKILSFTQFYQSFVLRN